MKQTLQQMEEYEERAIDAEKTLEEVKMELLAVRWQNVLSWPDLLKPMHTHSWIEVLLIGTIIGCDFSVWLKLPKFWCFNFIIELLFLSISNESFTGLEISIRTYSTKKILHSSFCDHVAFSTFSQSFHLPNTSRLSTTPFPLLNKRPRVIHPFRKMKL